MSRGDSVHTFENGGKEQSFFCMKLVSYLQRDKEVEQMDVEAFDNIWKERFKIAEAGSCHYRDECPIYQKNKKKGNIQLKLF